MVPVLAVDQEARIRSVASAGVFVTGNRPGCGERNPGQSSRRERCVAGEWPRP